MRVMNKLSYLSLKLAGNAQTKIRIKTNMITYHLVLSLQLEPLSEHQRLDISNLRQSCQQAEDALSHRMEKIHQIVADTIAGGRLRDGNDLPQISAAVGKLESLVRFVGQTNHLN